MRATKINPTSPLPFVLPASSRDTGKSILTGLLAPPPVAADAPLWLWMPNGYVRVRTHAQTYKLPYSRAPHLPTRLFDTDIAVNIAVFDSFVGGVYKAAVGSSSQSSKTTASKKACGCPIGQRHMPKEPRCGGLLAVQSDIWPTG